MQTFAVSHAGFHSSQDIICGYAEYSSRRMVGLDPELLEVRVNSNDPTRRELVCVAIGDDVTDPDLLSTHVKNFQVVAIA